ncbi:DUF6172 family protein [Thiomicrorhabdus arctica]|uniref:DUF6172 family protein n=1 Tax=Thiomicrorhabdus arctica TaxID=131540 RepID=UPI0003AABCB5|nr:DUF6172 family protein [Thiomicrorhabdus arctica]
MKKIFKLTHEKIKPARLADAIKSEVKKYIKRERKHALPKDADFWDFACKFGPDAESSTTIHLAEVSKCIDKAEADQLDSFYLEIIAKPAVRTHKPASAKSAEVIDEDDFAYEE